MAIATGTYTYPSYLEAVALEVGGPLDGNLSPDDLQKYNAIINRAVQEYYNSHEWTFLNKLSTLPTVINQNTYDAPEDYGSPLEGKAGAFTFNPINYWPEIEYVPEERLRFWIQAGQNFKFPPKWYTVRPKNQAGATTQRYEFEFFPVPSQVWTLEYTYRVQTNNLSADKPYPLGGTIHGKAILDLILYYAAFNIVRDPDRASFFRKNYYEQLEENKVNDGLMKSAVIRPARTAFRSLQGGGWGGMGASNTAGQVWMGDGWPVPFTGTAGYEGP